MGEGRYALTCLICFFRFYFISDSKKEILMLKMKGKQSQVCKVHERPTYRNLPLISGPIQSLILKTQKQCKNADNATSHFSCKPTVTSLTLALTWLCMYTYVRC